jgi:hypothetical protein
VVVVSAGFDMVHVTADDFRALSTAPRQAVERILRNVSESSVEGLCAWAVQLMRLSDPSPEIRLLHAFVLTSAIERYEQLGYEVQEANERC